ncbi:MAG: pyridoxal phosphate-dependent aminotransferase [Pseudomonadota bacterium]
MGRFDQVDIDFLRKRAALKWGKWGDDFLSLSVADLDFPILPEIKEGVIKALSEERTPYGWYGGDPDVLEVVCDKLNKKNKMPAVPADVHMVPGTMFAIFGVCYYALEPGDEAIICPAPIYPPFHQNVVNAKGTPVFSPMVFSGGPRIDLEALRSAVSPRTKMLMVCNPHNPCGAVLTRDELEGVAAIAREFDLLIFSDELYEDMVLEGSHVSLASLAPDLMERTITACGFSKAFGMAGFRVAYVVNRGRHMKALKKIFHDIIVHTDVLAQAAAKAALLHGDAWLEELKGHLRLTRDYSLERLNALSGIWTPRPQATPFLFPNVSSYGLTSQEMEDYLKNKAKVIVENGRAFGPPGEGHIRINAGTSIPVLEQAFDRIANALKLIK